MTSARSHWHCELVRLVRRPRDRGLRPARMRLFAVVAAVLFVASCGGSGSTRGEPDPHGATLRALQTVRSALPSGAETVASENEEPTWTSCDGRSGTEGWTDVLVVASFRSTLPGNQIVQHASRVLVAAGWKAHTQPDRSGSPSGKWTRVLPNGLIASAILAIGDSGDIGRHWELDAIAPPFGPQVEGC